MINKEVILQNKTGLHARPASLFVKEASKYTSEIKVVKDGKEYNAKSMIGVLSMGAAMGDRIIIKAVGSDEETAANNLVELISNIKE